MALKNKYCNLNFIKKRLIDFTLLQLMQRNAQLGTVSKFSLLSSYWFIYGIRAKFTIIDLSWAMLYFRRALALATHIVQNRRHILLVNERRMLTEAVIKIAEAAGELYVSGRWIGGIMTNYKRIWAAYHTLLKNKSFRELNYNKWDLKCSLDGIRRMTALPGLIFLNSISKNYWAACESYALRVPSVGLLDTDANAANVLYPVPSNDDSINSIFFFNQLLVKTALVNKMILLTSIMGSKILKKRKFLNKRGINYKKRNRNNLKKIK